MKKLATSLCEFFDLKIPSLENEYKWKIPDIAGFPFSGQSGYHQNIALKLHLKALWDNAIDNEERLKVAKMIVSDWGGVRANNKDTLISYISKSLSTSPPTPIKGVASYSKILAIVHPGRFAIYDARVAACLNAVQINLKIKDGLAFNYVPGRNNIIGNTSKKIGFTQDERFTTKQLSALGWQVIKRGETYERYIELLNLCLLERPHYSLASLEMVLFSSAEDECKKAMAS